MNYLKIRFTVFLLLLTILYGCKKAANILDVQEPKTGQQARLSNSINSEKTNIYCYKEQYYYSETDFFTNAEIKKVLATDYHLHTEPSENLSEKKTYIHTLFNSLEDYYKWEIDRDPKNAAFYNADFEYTKFIQRVGPSDPKYSSIKYRKEIDAIFKRYNLPSPFGNEGTPTPESIGEPCVDSATINLTLFDERSNDIERIAITAPFVNCENDYIPLMECVALREFSTYFYLYNRPRSTFANTFILSPNNRISRVMLQINVTNTNRSWWTQLKRPRSIAFEYANDFFYGSSRSQAVYAFDSSGGHGQPTSISDNFYGFSNLTSSCRLTMNRTY